jgi:hypothetical protein
MITDAAGSRETCIDTYLDTILELDETTVDGLRALGLEGAAAVR